MKAFLLILAVMTFGSPVFSQCPAGGLAIQSAACESPQGLHTDGVTCSTLKIKWTGGKNQPYLVKATCTDPATGSVWEAKVSQITCDNSGYCNASVAVKEGTTMNWSVQAVCAAAGANLHSTEVAGQAVYIPVCPQAKDSAPITAMQVYPNPASDYLTVEYTSWITGAVEFRIFEITGKKVATRSGNAAAKAGNRYTLDIHGLPPGVYLLETGSGKEISQAKFVIMRN